MKNNVETYLNYPGIGVFFQKGPGYQLESHKHSSYQVIFAFRGGFKCEVSEEEIQVPNGKALFIKPNVSHNFEAKSEKQERLVINISKKNWESLTKSMGEKIILEKDYLRFSTSSLTRQLINTTVICPNPKIQRSLLDSFLSLMLMEMSLQKSHLMLSLQSKNPTLQRVVEDINQNFRKKLDREKLAEKYGFSSRNLSRLFKAEFNLTPQQYHLQKRIEEAKTLISQDRLNLTEIAFELGFSSLSHFLDTFKKYTGSLPRIRE